MHVDMLISTGHGDEAGPGPETEDFAALIERAVGGPELPAYDGVPDTGPGVHSR
jgi:hypothetical protein